MRRTAIVAVPAPPVAYAEPLFDPRHYVPSGIATLAPRDLLRLGAIATLLMLIPALGAAVFSSTREKIYGAVVEIVYDAAPAATSPAQIDREFATQEVIVRSRTVLGPVAQKNNISIEDLEEAVDVDVIPGTQVLRVIVADRDAVQATELSQAIAETYIGLAITQAARLGGRTSGEDERRLEKLTTKLATLESDAAEAARRGQVARETAFRTEAAEVLRQVGSLRDRLNLVPGSSLKGTPRVFVPAHVLAQPLSPKPLRAAAGGALAGALIATAVVLYLLRRRSLG